jgi:hypothetical protein
MLRDWLRDRLLAWFTFAIILMIFSEWIVWQTPTTYTPLEWLGMAAVYLALAGLTLDLMARLHANDIFSLLLVAGLYGLMNALLISHIDVHDLPTSLLIRPLGAQPLAFMGALASFQILTSGRATGPIDLIIAAFAGFLWGIWVRWFPVVADDSIPTVASGYAMAAVGTGLLFFGALRMAVPLTGISRRGDWMLWSFERWLVGGILAVALVIGLVRGTISPVVIGLVLLLGSFMVAVSLITLKKRRRRALLLASMTPPHRPNLAAWVILIVPFLILGWLGYHLPGSGDSSPQSDLLFGILLGFGLIWLPAVSTVLGVRAFIELARESG